MPEPASTAIGRQVLTVRVGEEHLAISASDVAEVVRLPAITRVPLGPPGLTGVANLHGTVVPVISLRALLGAADGTSRARGRVVVVDRGSPLGLLVDEVTALTDPGSVQGDRPGGESASRGGKPPRLLDIDDLLARSFENFGRQSGRREIVDARVRRQAPARGRDEVSLVSFDAGGQEYALPLDRVNEVVALPGEVAVVPRSGDAMLGVMSLRGQLLPLASLPALLGLRATARDRRSPKVLVTRVDGARLGLVADGMREILRVPSGAIDPVPTVLMRGAAEAEIQSICRLDGGRRLVSILSTDRLLRDATRNGYLSGADATIQDSLVSDSQADETEQFVVFHLGGEEYGLPVAAVDEIVRVPQTLTRLPTAPAFVEGVMNRRGRVIPIIDQRRRFAFERGGETRRERVIVVAIDQMLAGFIVDRVSEVLRVPVSQLRPAPDLAFEGSRVVDRIANVEVDGRMILLVDARELLDRAERDLLAAIPSADPDRSGS